METALPHRFTAKRLLAGSLVTVQRHEGALLGPDGEVFFIRRQANRGVTERADVTQRKSAALLLG